MNLKNGNGWIYFALFCWVVSIVTGEHMKGHLKPLGSHKEPGVKVDEFNVNNHPTPYEFYEQYVKISRAAIFRGAITDSRAYSFWTDEYIRENYGEMEVRLEGKQENHHLPPIGEKYLGRDTLRHFVDIYHNVKDNSYVVSDLPSAMYKDVDVIPSFGSCGEMNSRIIEVDLWWSSGGTSSVLHKDAFHQINCLINGTKQWKLIEYKHEKHLHKHPEPEKELGGYSDINPQAVDMEKHPNISKIDWSNITIFAGDCLYLPKSYYHQVESYGTNNLAISLLFARFDERESLDFSDCTDDTDYKNAKPLSEYDVQHVWNGKGMMVMGRSDLEEHYRKCLLETTNQCKGKKCDNNTIEKMFWVIAPPEGQLMQGSMEKAFYIMDKNNDGFVSDQEVLDLSLNDLKLIGDEVSMYEPSNSYDFEYSIISFENVWWAINHYMKKYSYIDRTTWITKYKLLGGTEKFGNEIFTKLSGGEDYIVSESISEDDIWCALDNWIYYWSPQYSSLSAKPLKKDSSLLFNLQQNGEFDWLENRDKDHTRETYERTRENEGTHFFDEL